MKLIKPSEISARILTLLDESDERVVIVSPYMKISKWYKFINKVNELKTKRIHTDIYVRDDPDNTATFRDLDLLALEYKKIPHLHCKLYLNEKSGIVTSMNLLLSSEINSLEIGYITETWEEYNDLQDYFHRHIHIGESIHCETIAGQPAADLKEIMHRMREEFKRTAKISWLWYAENALQISAGGNYFRVTINDNYLRITASLRVASATDQQYIQCASLITKKIGDLTAMKVKMNPGSKSVSNPGSKSVSNPGSKSGSKSGSKPVILQLTGQAPTALKSTSIKFILKHDVAYILETVTRFIEVTNDLVYPHG